MGLNRLQMVKFEWPWHWKPPVSSFSGVGRISFSHYWPSGVIRIGSPVWKWKFWKIFRIKGAQQAANGPVWMALALKTPCLILFWSWENSLFPLMALWGNKNWLPSMKGKKLENFQNRWGSTGCKWSSLNGPGTENPLSHPFLELGELPFPINGPLG